MLGWGCLRYIRRQNREIDHSVVVKAPWITALLYPLISVTFLAHCCKMSCRWDIKANTRKFRRCRILNLARIFSLVPSSHPLDMETCLGWKGDLNIGFKRIFGIKKGWQYSQTRHLAITAVKPLEYQDKKRARTEPQKPPVLTRRSDKVPNLGLGPKWDESAKKVPKKSRFCLQVPNFWFYLQMLLKWGGT